MPYVVETSVGLDRTFLAILSSSYKEEILEDGSERVVLKLPAKLAPVKVAVFPLLRNKPELVKKAKDVFKEQKIEKFSIAPPVNMSIMPNKVC